MKLQTYTITIQARSSKSPPTQRVIDCANIVAATSWALNEAARLTELYHQEYCVCSIVLENSRNGLH